MRTLLATSLLCLSAYSALFSLTTETTTNKNVIVKTLVFRTVGNMTNSSRISATRIPNNLTNKLVQVLDNSFRTAASQLKGVQIITKDK